MAVSESTAFTLPALQDSPPIFLSLCVQTEEHIYIFGGKTENRPSPHRPEFVRRLDLASLRVENILSSGMHRPAKSLLLQSGAYDPTNNRIIIFGGAHLDSHDPTNSYLTNSSNSIHFYNILTNCWSEPLIRGIEPQARMGATIVIFDGSLYLFGGSQSNSLNSHIEIFKDLWKFDLNPAEAEGTEEYTWVQISGNHAHRRRRRGRRGRRGRKWLWPGPRTLHTANVISQSMFVFGGVGIMTSPTGDGGSSSSGGSGSGADGGNGAENWVVPSLPRKCLGDLWEFNFISGRWRQRVGMRHNILQNLIPKRNLIGITEPTERSLHSASVVGNGLVVSFGLARINKPYVKRSMYMFDTSRGTWRRIFQFTDEQRHYLKEECVPQIQTNFYGNLVSYNPLRKDFIVVGGRRRQGFVIRVSQREFVKEMAREELKWKERVERSRRRGMALQMRINEMAISQQQQVQVRDSMRRNKRRNKKKKRRRREEREEEEDRGDADDEAQWAKVLRREGRMISADQAGEQGYSLLGGSNRGS